MNSTRRTAVAAGVFFVITFVGAIAGVLVPCQLSRFEGVEPAASRT